MSYLPTQRLLKKGLIIGGCLFFSSTLAGGTDIATSPGLPLPGFSLYGLGGNGWTAIGDMLAPVFGRQSSFTFIDPQIYYHSTGSDYTGSLGAGHRWLTENTGIVGAYVFGDYNHTDDGHAFWFVSPGVERLGERVDLSANLYIPVSSQRIDTGLKFADEVGDSSQIVFSGHDQFDELVNTFLATGYGGDAQIGVRLPFRNSKIYLGGYYFSPKDSDNIGGGAVRLQVPVNDYISVLVSEAYDSTYNNTVKAGLTIWFGGRHTGYSFMGDLAERLVDPIQRNLVAVAGGSNTAQPVVSNYENTGEMALELSNISFFVPGGIPSDSVTVAQGDGTYENPYVGMTQSNVDDGNAQNNTNFYVDSGTYNAQYGMTNPDYIVLNNDQVYGRQNNFREAAQGIARPVINFSNGGFEIPGTDTNDSINNLQIVGPSMAGSAGIWVNHDNTSMNDQVVVINNTVIKNFGDGIDILNDAANTLWVSINRSLVTNNSGGAELLSSDKIEGGVAAANINTGTLNLNVTGSTISGNNNALVNGDNFNAVGGIAAYNPNALGTMNINVNRSSISGNVVKLNEGATSGVFVSQVTAAGGLAAVNMGTMNLTVNHSNLTGNAVTLNDGASNSPIATSTVVSAGGLAVDNTGGTMNIDISHSSLSGNTVTLNDGAIGGTIISQVTAAGGLAAVNTGTMNIKVSNSHLTGNAVTLNDGASDSNSVITGTVSSAGGLAVSNTNGTMNIDISHSSLSGNIVTLNDGVSNTSFGPIITHVDSAGGLAVNNVNGTMNIDVSHSSLSGNTVTFNDGVTDTSSGPIIATGFSVGGLAANNTNGTMNIDISHSSLSGNIFTFSDGVTNTSFGTILSSASDVGGLAVTNTTGASGTVNINVSHSSLSGNIVTLNDGASNDGAGVVTTPVSVAGGFAVTNNGGGTMNINVSHSSLSGNTVTLNDGVTNDGSGTMIASVTSVGGLAASNTSNGTMNVDISHSSLSGNMVTLNDGATNNGAGSISTSASAGGGLAVINPVTGTVNIDISHSSLSGNTVTLNDGATNSGSGTMVAAMDVAGGLAVSNANGTVNIDISHSSLSGNTVTLNDGATNNGSGSMVAASDTAGGLAAANSGTMNIDIRNSSLSGNIVTLNDGATNGSIGTMNAAMNSAGGFAVYNQGVGTMDIDISHSSVSGNMVMLNDGAMDSIAQIGSAGGLAVNNQGGGTMDIDISHSSLSGNTTELNAGATAQATGGIAIVNSAATTTTTVSHSNIIGNDNGIDVVGANNTVTADLSVIAWNSNAALIANNGATIDISDPIFFSGIVNTNTPGSINIQGLTPTSGQNILCLFGQCQVVL